MTSTLKTLLAIAALTCAAAVSAQELKIGFVNLDRVLRDAAMAKAKLESEFTKREKELLDGDSRLKNSSERFERDSAALGESERGRRQRDLMEQDRELQRKRREFQEDLNQRKNEELAKVLETANRVVKQIFEQDKYDLIVQESVFASLRVDITDKVIKAMNAGSGK
jgi:outer membrane protein